MTAGGRRRPVLLGQGMGREPVRPDWAPLGRSEAGAALAAWGLRAGAVCWRSPRPFSSAAVVEVVGGECRPQVFVKRHDLRIRDVASLEVEHAFAAHLRAGGVPVPEVLATTDGGTAVAKGGWAYEVQGLAPGEDRYRDALSWTPYRDWVDARAAGRALSGLHAAAAGFALPGRPPGPLVPSTAVASADDPVGAMERQVAARPALAAALQDRVWQDEVAMLLAPWEPAPTGTLWGHGDWHPSNLTWTAASVRAVLDLGLAAPYGAAFDVAVAIERAAVGWLDLAEGRTPAVDWMGVGAFLGGYRSEAPLDCAAVAACLPLAHVDFALAEVEYFAGVVGSATNATLAWDSYLRGHLAWWAGAAGRRLLDVVAAGGKG